ncbi:MAG: peptidylprolyl isomerase [Myxococcales bacterium]|nr:peptidylprolyl isomerase [Myxococcales bacterium]
MPAPQTLLSLALAACLAATSAGCRCGAEPPPPARSEQEARQRLRAALREIQHAEWRRTDDARITIWIGDGRPDVRAHVARLIGRVGLSRYYLPLAEQLLVDDDVKVRREAAFALRLLGLDGRGPSIALTVARALARRLPVERDARVRELLVIGLGWTARSEAFSLLAPLVAHDDDEGDAAILAMGMLGKRNVGAPTHSSKLLGALVSARPRRRLLACWAIYRLGGSADDRVLGALRRLAADTRAADRHSSEARAWAIRALAARPPAKQLEWLVARLRDPEPLVQQAVFESLARLGTTGAVELAKHLPKLFREVGASHQRLTGARLAPLLAGIDALRPHARTATVRGYAQRVLESSDGGKAAVKYSPVEKHAVDLIHCKSAALVDIGWRRVEYTPTCGTTHAAALSPTWRRALVVHTIAEINRSPEWKLTVLRRYLGDAAPRVRAAAVDALASMESSTAPLAPLVRAAGDRDHVVVASAAQVVKKRARLLSGVADTLSAKLAAHLQDLNVVVEPEVACTLIDALVALRAREALPVLRWLAEGAAWAVRRCASRGLASLGVTDRRPTQWLSRGLPDMRWTKRGDAAPPTKAVLVTDKGEAFIELYAKTAPATVANFARLALRRFFRGKRFHRVVPGFVVQGGDPRGDGWGGPGYTIPCELSPRPYVRGALGMALAGRDSGGSQFFIALARQPHLDGRYTIFGRVLSGMDVIDRVHEGARIKDLYITETFPARAGLFERPIP